MRADAGDAGESAGEAGRGRSVLAIGRAAAAAVLATETEELAMRIGMEEGAHVVSTLQRPSDALGLPHVIALAGHSPQATLFAVYTFAEEALGAQVRRISGSFSKPEFKRFCAPWEGRRLPPEQELGPDLSCLQRG